MIPHITSEVWIAGAGISGRGCAQMARRLGWNVVIIDDRSDAASDLAADVDGRWMSTDSAIAQIDSAELIVTSPGWSPRTPLLAAAEQAGVPVIGDVELAWRADHDGCFGAPRTWVVVTGTNGKTTTTAMAAAMLVEAGRAAEAVGNIGVSVASAATATPRIDVMVAELSSFQLHWSPLLAPAAGVVINIAEDHLDWHGSLENYARDKARALRGPVAVVNVDDPLVTRYAAEVQRPEDAWTVGFTVGEPEVGQLGVLNGRLVDRAFHTLPTGEVALNHDPEHLVDLGDATTISPHGPAGIADALAAAALARSQGASGEAIARALANFRVRAHRGQVVYEHGGVRWVDNSKATNPHAADAALRSYDSVVWVAGGQLKGAQVDDLITTHGPKIHTAIVLGQDWRIIADAFAAHHPETRVVTVTTRDPQRAMDEVGRIAAALARPGDCVLLAPAAASLDMYTGMAQRGDLFAEAAATYGAQVG